MARQLDIQGSDRPALVDDEDLEWLSRRPWRLTNKWCIACDQNKHLGHRQITIGRLIVEKAEGRILRPEEIVRHRNGDVYDCRRENLGIVAREDFRKEMGALMAAGKRQAAIQRRIDDPRPERPEYRFFRPGRVLLVCRSCMNGIPCDGLVPHWLWCECRNLAVKEWQAAARDPELVRVESRPI